MADWAIMVIAIVAITTFGRIYAMKHGLSWRGRKDRGERWENPQLNQENQRLTGEVTQLKDRIATLERIATDRRHRLADEIDALGPR